MTMRPKDYVARLRDTTLEHQLAKELRKQPENKRFDFIVEMIHDQSTGDLSHLIVGLWLANTCLRSRPYLLQLFEKGIETADASTIRFYLKFLIPKLGVRRSLSILEKKRETHPVKVRQAFYWFDQIISEQDRRTIEKRRARSESSHMTRQQALGFIKNYGDFIPDIPFDAVALHALADEIDLLNKLAITPQECTSCDIYWAYREEVFLVSVWCSTDKKTLVTYHRKDQRQAGHRFYVMTRQPCLSIKEINNTLSRLAAWLDNHSGVFQKAYAAKQTIIISDEDWARSSIAGKSL
jgi:hypothetical protein